MPHIPSWMYDNVDLWTASKITLEEVSIIFDGKHAVQNDLLVKQEATGHVENIEESKSEDIVKQEVAVKDA